MHDRFESLPAPKDGRVSKELYAKADSPEDSQADPDRHENLRDADSQSEKFSMRVPEDPRDYFLMPGYETQHLAKQTVHDPDRRNEEVEQQVDCPGQTHRVFGSLRA